MTRYFGYVAVRFNRKFTRIERKQIKEVLDENKHIQAKLGVCTITTKSPRDTTLVVRLLREGNRTEHIIDRSNWQWMEDKWKV